MGQLILALLAWITAETGLSVPAPPVVELISAESMQRLAKGNADVKAIYAHDTKTIQLRDDWQAADLRSRATLLHELVHHVQYSNDVPMSCPAEYERLAYNLTVKWLREQGVADPYEMLHVDEFTIIFLSLCHE